MGATKELAEFTCNTTYKDFDTEVIKHTKDLCLSGIGMTVAGVPMRTSQGIIRYVKGIGAAPEAGVMGAGFRTSMEYAVLANGTISHCTELEDDSFPEGTYMVGTFPTAFALGEKFHLSGKEVIELIIIGYEVTSRTALTCLEAMRRGFAIAPIFGCLGAAAMTAKVLKLGVHETTMAISLAASQSAGIITQTGTGAHLYEAGTCQRSGISAAMLAKEGLTGQPNIIECPNGLCDAVAGVTNPELHLGKFRIRDVGVKKYPCCFLQMHIIDTVRGLIKEHKLSADDVENVQVDLHAGFLRLVRYHHPSDSEFARFSLPHSIAACFLNDKVFLDSYSDEAAQDPKYHEFREKVTIVPHTDWDVGGISGREIPVLVRMKGGTEYKKMCPPTDAPVIVSDEELREKYNSCATLLLSRKQADEAAKLILALEDVKDVTQLMDIVTFPEGSR